MEKELFKAVWTLVGVTVGAGILGLPFVVAKSGFLTGLLVILLISIVMILINLYLGEILLRTRIRHQLSGLAGIYLGKFGKYFVVIFESLSIYGALVAYVIGAGLALKAIFGGNEFLYSVLFFIVLSIVIFFSLNILGEAESILNPLKILIILILCFILIKKINLSNLGEFSFYKILIPYGVTMFAFTGFSVIPEMNNELRNKFNLKKALIIGTLITTFVYVLFTFSVVGAVDGNVNEVATTSLGLFGENVSLFANLLALFAMTTAFLGLGFALKENFSLDLGFKNIFSWLMVIVIPFLLFVINVGDFIFFLGLSGTFAIGILFLLVLIMHSKAKKMGDRKPEYELKDNWIVKGALFLLFLIGMIYSLIGII